jgi:DNA-binding transcriptional ArsR family regulator
MQLKPPSGERNSASNTDLDNALTATTLEVYRYIVTHSNKGIGPREIQRSLKMSSPAVAIFHLEKLERNGLVSKQEDGTYLVDKIYLKHFVLLRRRLIPKYFFYAALSSAFLIGWMNAFFIGGKSSSFYYLLFGSPAVLYVFVYGIISTSILAGIFWFETLKVFKKERI